MEKLQHAQLDGYILPYDNEQTDTINATIDELEVIPTIQADINALKDFNELETHDVTNFNTGFSSFDAQRKVRYTKQGNLVILGGLLRVETTDRIAFNLPEGFRPNRTIGFPVYANVGATRDTVGYSVMPNGDVSISNVGHSWAYLDSIVFFVGGVTLLNKFVNRILDVFGGVSYAN